jgi:hypothetical protein
MLLILRLLLIKFKKMLGGKLNIPQTNSGSNPLGGMLKGIKSEQRLNNDEYNWAKYVRR